VYSSGAGLFSASGKVTTEVTSLEYTSKLALDVATIKDTRTGLEWQNNYSSNGGKVESIYDDSWVDKPKDYCSKLEGGGWAIPSDAQLLSLYKSKKLHNPPSGMFWTTYENNKYRTEYIRCVRSLKRSFVDSKTGLRWQDDQVTRMEGGYKRSKAIHICSKLKLNGKGWRLPTSQELLDVYSRYNFQNDNKMNEYWTSTLSSNRSDLVRGVTGEKGNCKASSSFYYNSVRCVRNR